MSPPRISVVVLSSRILLWYCVQAILFRSGLFVLIACAEIDSNVGCLLACFESGITQIVNWLSYCVIQETDGDKVTHELYNNVW